MTQSYIPDHTRRVNLKEAKEFTLLAYAAMGRGWTDHSLPQRLQMPRRWFLRCLWGKTTPYQHELRKLRGIEHTMEPAPVERHVEILKDPPTEPEPTAMPPKKGGPAPLTDDEVQEFLEEVEKRELAGWTVAQLAVAAERTRATFDKAKRLKFRPGRSLLDVVKKLPLDPPGKAPAPAQLAPAPESNADTPQQPEARQTRASTAESPGATVLDLLDDARQAVGAAERELSKAVRLMEQAEKKSIPLLRLGLNEALRVAIDQRNEAGRLGNILSIR